MVGIIQNSTVTAANTAKAALSPFMNYLQNVSTMTGKARLVAAGAAGDSATSVLNFIAQKGSTGLSCIAISRLESGDRTAWLLLGATIFASYALLCNALRFRRRDQLQKKYGYYDRESMGRMTTTEAQEILKTLIQSEWPLLYMTSIEFALFKVSYTSRIQAKAEDSRDKMLNDLEVRSCPLRPSILSPARPDQLYWDFFAGRRRAHGAA